MLSSKSLRHVRQAQTPSQQMPLWLRARTLYLALALGTIAVGLAVHRSGALVGPAVRDVLGDALWAGMMVWWIAALGPGVRPWVRGAVALTICFAVEMSQLSHIPALDAARRTVAGRLILGSGFDPRDFAAYALGVVAATLLDRVTIRRRRRDRGTGMRSS